MYSRFQLRLNGQMCVESSVIEPVYCTPEDFRLAPTVVTDFGMSAEPGRKAPYSDDTRWRVVWQRAGMQLSFRQVAKNLNISVGTVYNIFKVFEKYWECRFY